MKPSIKALLFALCFAADMNGYSTRELLGFALAEPETIDKVVVLELLSHLSGVDLKLAIGSVKAKGILGSTREAVENAIKEYQQEMAQKMNPAVPAEDIAKLTGISEKYAQEVAAAKSEEQKNALFVKTITNGEYPGGMYLQKHPEAKKLLHDALQ